jgi:hypothetical protein
VAAALLLSGFTARAGVIYNNFGPGDSHDPTTGYMVSGFQSPFQTNSVAMPFTSAVNDTITQIDVALAHVLFTNTATLTLSADNSGLPGSQIAMWSLGPLPATGSCCSVVTISTSIPVSSGTTYWLTASAFPNPFDAWLLNNTGATGQYWTSAQGLVSGTLGAFDVMSAGPTVPEPGTILGGAAALLLAVVYRRRGYLPARHAK